jgi:hypothetical protein
VTRRVMAMNRYQRRCLARTRRRGHYLARAVALGLRLRDERGPGLYFVAVQHETWCRRPGGGPCTCGDRATLRLLNPDDGGEP